MNSEMMATEYDVYHHHLKHLQPKRVRSFKWLRVTAIIVGIVFAGLLAWNASMNDPQPQATQVNLTNTEPGPTP